MHRLSKTGDVFFGWSMWMEADGYSAGAPITFNFDNGSGTYTYHGKIAGSFVSADTYLVIPEEVYRSVNPKGHLMDTCGWIVLKRCGICRAKPE